MKGSNRTVTVTGSIAAGFFAVSQLPFPVKYEGLKFPCVVLAALFGGVTAYLAKGKNVTGGDIDNKGNSV